MPVYEYTCSADHTTTRIIAFDSKRPEFPDHNVPKYITCPVADLTKVGWTCRRRAHKQTVYRVSVSGDLPTRGAF